VLLGPKEGGLLQAGCPAAPAPRRLWALAVATSAGVCPCIIFEAG